MVNIGHTPTVAHNAQAKVGTKGKHKTMASTRFAKIVTSRMYAPLLSGRHRDPATLETFCQDRVEWTPTESGSDHRFGELCDRHLHPRL
jgi:hypothetical protein